MLFFHGLIGQDFPDIPESFKSRASNLEWSIECLSWIRPYMDEIEDPDRRQLVESILDTFDKEVVPKIKTLRKCKFALTFLATVVFDL